MTSQLERQHFITLSDLAQIELALRQFDYSSEQTLDVLAKASSRPFNLMISASLLRQSYGDGTASIVLYGERLDYLACNRAGQRWAREHLGETCLGFITTTTPNDSQLIRGPEPCWLSLLELANILNLRTPRGEDRQEINDPSV